MRARVGRDALLELQHALALPHRVLGDARIVRPGIGLRGIGGVVIRQRRGVAVDVLVSRLDEIDDRLAGRDGRRQGEGRAGENDALFEDEVRCVRGERAVGRGVEILDRVNLARRHRDLERSGRGGCRGQAVHEGRGRGRGAPHGLRQLGKRHQHVAVRVEQVGLERDRARVDDLTVHGGSGSGRKWQ